MEKQQSRYAEHDVLQPSELLKKAGLESHMVVADCGAGADGPFSLAAAKIVGAQGVVYALDVMQPALEQLKRKAQSLGHQNVQTVWTDLEVYGAAKAVASGSVDVAILANTLFQSRDHVGIFTEISRMLKVGGRVLVIEWNTVDTPLGPAQEQRVSLEAVTPMAAIAHLERASEFSAGEFHWAAVFSKNG